MLFLCHRHRSPNDNLITNHTPSSICVLAYHACTRTKTSLTVTYQHLDRGTRDQEQNITENVIFASKICLRSIT